MARHSGAALAVWGVHLIVFVVAVLLAAVKLVIMVLIVTLNAKALYLVLGQV